MKESSKSPWLEDGDDSSPSPSLSDPMSSSAAVIGDDLSAAFVSIDLDLLPFRLRSRLLPSPWE
jgi:hypothetical protein